MDEAVFRRSVIDDDAKGQFWNYYRSCLAFKEACLSEWEYSMFERYWEQIYWNHVHF